MEFVKVELEVEQEVVFDSLMVNKDVFHLIKYDGVNGLVVEATVKEKEPFNSYAFVKGYSGSSALQIANAEKDNYYLVLGNEVMTFFSSLICSRPFYKKLVS